MKIEGKAAVVTGASRGVGRATAIALAAGGCSVVVNYSTSKDEADAVVVSPQLGHFHAFITPEGTAEV